MRFLTYICFIMSPWPALLSFFFFFSLQKFIELSAAAAVLFLVTKSSAGLPGRDFLE